MNSRFLHNVFSLNWCATISLNYRVGGMAAVFRMPVKVYGKLRHQVTGRIVLPTNAIRNTLIIGSQHEDYTASAGKAQITIAGTWRVNGITRIGHDCFIGVAEGATLTMGDACFIGRDSQIHCSNSVSIGSEVFAGELYITDSTEHVISIDGREKEMQGEVRIGDGTYLGHRSMLLKGSVIPPASVVASGAVCTKDYTDAGASQLFLAGVPAKVKRENTCASR